MPIRLILLVTSLYCCVHFCHAQDKVYLLNGDSASANITADPRKETDLADNTIGRLNDYGFKSVIALYKKDSVRIHRPGEIRGYFRQQKGNYLGAGYFFSRTINEKQLGYKHDHSRPVFLQRVNFHKDIIIWFYREDLGHSMPASYFLIEVKGREHTDLVTSYQEWKKWAVDHPPLGELTYQKGKPKTGNNRDGNFFKYLVEIMEEYKKKYP